MLVRAAGDGDREWVRRMLTESWGETRIVACGRSRDAAALEALVAEDGGRAVGLLTYDMGPAGLEIVTLNATERGRGAGGALLAAARRVAAERGVARTWLITTNDNLDALRFYQRRGMRIARVHPGAVDRARLAKPSIPRVGEYGIAIADEIELEFAGVTVREAALDEAGAVLGLLDEASEWLVSLGRTGQWGTEPHSTNPRRRAALAQWLPQGQVHVAQAEGRIAGALAVGAAPSHVPQARIPELYVNLLVTSRHHRGGGLGGALLDHARSLAVRRGLPLLRVDCYGGDDRALVGWYERQGFTATEPFTVRLPDGRDWPGQVLQQRL